MSCRQLLAPLLSLVLSLVLSLLRRAESLAPPPLPPAVSEYSDKQPWPRPSSPVRSQVHLYQPPRMELLVRQAQGVFALARVAQVRAETTGFADD